MRHYADTPVPEDFVRDAVTAALYAPRAGGQQHWRVIAVTDKSVMKDLKKNVETEIARQRALVSSPRALAGFDGYTAYFTHFADAPLTLILVAKPYDSIYIRILNKYAGDDAVTNAMGMLVEPAVISAAMAAENLMLALHAYGIGSCFMTGPLIVQKYAEDFFSIKEPEHVVGLITAGYPAVEYTPPDEKKRRSETAETLIDWR
jgi:nitroreductase